MQERSYENNKKIAHIRHNETDYDKYDVFYHLFPWARKRLNWNCAMFAEDEINLIDLVDAQEQIADKINLFKKCNQKQFLLQTVCDLQDIYPEASNSFVKNMAKTILKNNLRRQEIRNLKRTKNKQRIYIID